MKCKRSFLYNKPYVSGSSVQKSFFGILYAIIILTHLLRVPYEKIMITKLVWNLVFIETFDIALLVTIYCRNFAFLDVIIYFSCRKSTYTENFLEIDFIYILA